MRIDDDSTHAEDAPLPDIAGEGPWVFAGRFEIIALVGAGGMGSVYKAFDRELEEIVALKVIRRELLRLPGIVERFRREVKLARRITHRNVGRVFDMGEADGERFFSMELVEGRSLDTFLDSGPLPVELALSVARDLASGLAAAHEAGVIHRDLKPDNVLLANDGRAVITDFGIARSLTQPSGPVTLEGGWIGTPIYMAPELVSGQTVADELCDIFAYGTMMFELVTGELPWKGATEVAIAMERLRRDAPDPRSIRPEIPDELATLLLRCLERDRAKRIGSAAEIARALGAIDLAPTSAVPTKRWARGDEETLPLWSIGEMPAALLDSAPGSRKTVAVLPLKCIDATIDADLAEGFLEAIVETLSLSPALRVRPAGMTRQLGKQHLSTLDAGKALGVQVIVDGTMAREGERIVVAVRAATVEDRFPIWSGKFERPAPELFELADEIGAAVASRLSAPRREPTRGAVDRRATELYLRARRAYHDFWHADAARAVGLFTQALALAPNDGVILAGYALACVRLANFTGQAMDRAREAVQRASAIEPDLPEVHLARASLLVQDGDPANAVRSLKRALARSPALGEANWLLGRVLVEADVIEAGMKRLEWSLAIEPGLHLARRDLSRANALLGRFDEFERLAAADPERDGPGVWLDRARFAVWRGRRESAVAQLDALARTMGGDRPIDPDETVGSSGALGVAIALLALAARGQSPFDAPDFVEFLRVGSSTPRRAAFTEQIRAETWAALGRDDEALASIELAVDAGLTDLAWLDRCPLFGRLRARSALEAVRSKVGAVAAMVREAAFDE